MPNETDKTIDFMRGFEAGSAEAESKLSALREERTRLLMRLQVRDRWLDAARYAIDQSRESGGPNA